MKKLLILLTVLTLALSACSSAPTDDLVQYNSYNEVADALGYNPNTPFDLPGVSYEETFWIVDGEIFQAIYKNDEQTITYRMVKETGADIGGVDLSTYNESEINKSKGFDVEMLGKDGVLHFATWSEDNKTFSIFFENGVSAEDFDIAIKGV